MKKLLMPVLFCALLVGGWGCASHKKTTNAPAALQRNVTMNSYNMQEFDRRFFEAQKEKLTGNYQKAVEYFQDALRVDPDNSACYYEIGAIYFNQARYKEAEEMLTKAVKLSPKNKWYEILLGDIYQNQKKWTEAAKQYETLISQEPDERDYYLNLAGIYIYQNKINDAMKVYDRVEKRFGPSSDLIMQKHKIYYALGKYDKAVEEINKLLKDDPENPQYLELLGETYLKSGQNEKAFEVFQKLEKMHPDDPVIQVAIADYYYKKNDKAKGLDMLKKAFANPGMSVDTKVQILYANYLMKDVDSATMNEALELCDIFVRSNPKEAKAHALYGDLLYTGKKLDQARIEYRKSTELKKDVFAVWQQLMLIESTLRDNKALEEESAKALELFPDQPVLYFFNGLAKNELKKYKQAIETFNSGLALVTDNKALELQFYINLAEAYYREKSYSRSDENFEKALTLDANNTLALNNYAYYLSVRNEKLDKAETMSKKTVELDPKNASYQDTYGWILFKRGRYDEAEQWIHKAIDQDHSAEVTEHYGDVMYKLGKVDEAVKYWNEAKKLGSDSQQLDQKIVTKKLVE